MENTDVSELELYNLIKDAPGSLLYLGWGGDPSVTDELESKFYRQRFKTSFGALMLYNDRESKGTVHARSTGVVYRLLDWYSGDYNTYSSFHHDRNYLVATYKGEVTETEEAAVPEPSSVMGLAAIGLAGVIKRKVERSRNSSVTS